MADDTGAGGQGDTGAGGNGDGTSFLDGITDEGVRANEALKGIENLDGLATKYLEANQNLADLKASQPTVPDSVEAYAIDIPKEVEGAVDEADLGAFKEAALGMRLTPEQYQGIMQFEFARAARLAEEYDKGQDEVMNELKKELGDGWEAALERANKVLAAIPGGEQLLESIELGDHAPLFKLMKWVGDNISEDILETGGGTGGEGDTRPRDETGKPQLQYEDM